MLSGLHFEVSKLLDVGFIAIGRSWMLKDDLQEWDSGIRRRGPLTSDRTGPDYPLSANLAP